MSKKLVSRYNQWLFGAVAFLLIFIPLYPKIPLFSPIEQYIVRVRLEDIFIALIGLYWLGLLVLRKVIVPQKVLGLIALYVVVSGISLFSAIFVLGSIPQQQVHIAKSVLHLFRYIEYFSLLFLAFSAVRTKKQLQIVLSLITGIVIATSIYGVGQRYFQFPVYSTMNREFSKGVRLVLESPYARVQSTFAGHYDFGAFLVITLPVILALALLAQDRYSRWFAWTGFTFGVWGLLASASRSSFIGFLGGIGIVLLLTSLLEKKLIAQVISFCKKSLISYGLVGAMMLLFGGNLTQLFVNTIQGIPVLNTVYLTALELLPQSDKIDNAVIPQYTNPVPAKNTEAEEEDSSTERPPDVYVDIPDKIEVITISDTGVEVITYQERPRTFSQCAQEKGLSLCIRLEALWPQAINGFKRNPLLGSGFATLNKKNIFHFPDADGTDNNYLRILGETGVLGLITFFSIIGYVVFIAIKILIQTMPASSSMKSNALYQVVAIGYIAGTAGLLVNAIYIDVFVASKVAYMFWSMTGVLLAVSRFKKT